MFKNALAHVQRNYIALLIYMAIATSYFAVRTAIEYYLIGKLDVDTTNFNHKIYLIVGGIVTAIVIAFAQSLAFIRMGTDIDRPFWKADPSIPTLLRYTSFWFTLNYINIAILLFVILSPFSYDIKSSIELLRNVFELFIIPFGATVMFYGYTTRFELAQAFRTMILQLPRFLLVAFFGLVFQSILLVLQSKLPLTASPVLAIIGAYFDCFIFAYVWEICIFNRDHEEEPDDIEF